MTLEEALNKAAAELPEGCTISVVVERGAGNVECSDNDGHVMSLDSADKTLAEQVIEHLEFLKDADWAELNG